MWGQMLNTSNPMEIIDELRTHRSIRIFVSDRPVSICSAKILSVLLHKELMKFEVGFPLQGESYDSDTDFCIFVNLMPGDCKKFLVFGDKESSSVEAEAFTCTCAVDEIHPCVLSYSLAKAMNYINPDILWSMMMCFEFYRIFTKEDLVFEDNKENYDDEENEEHTLDGICKGCKELYLDLVFEVQKRSGSTDVDGIYYKKRPTIPFLGLTTLFSALQNDVSFVLEKKLYRMKNRRTGDQRIYEHLARKGISKRNSQEMYPNLGYQAKRLIGSQFRQVKGFYKRIGHSVEITAVENFFLMCYHLLNDSKMNAFLCTSSKGLTEVEKSVRLYKEFIDMYKECIASHKRLSNTLFFTIHTSDVFLDMPTGLLLHLYSYYFGMFMRRKHKDSCNQIIVLKHSEDKLILSGDDHKLMSKLREIGEDVGEYVVVERLAFSKLLEQLWNDKSR